MFFSLLLVVAIFFLLFFCFCFLLFIIVYLLWRWTLGEAVVAQHSTPFLLLPLFEFAPGQNWRGRGTGPLWNIYVLRRLPHTFCQCGGWHRTTCAWYSSRKWTNEHRVKIRVISQIIFYYYHIVIILMWFSSSSTSFFLIL